MVRRLVTCRKQRQRSSAATALLLALLIVPAGSSAAVDVVEATSSGTVRQLFAYPGYLSGYGLPQPEGSDDVRIEHQHAVVAAQAAGIVEVPSPALRKLKPGGRGDKPHGGGRSPEAPKQDEWPAWQGDVQEANSGLETIGSPAGYEKEAPLRWEQVAEEVDPADVDGQVTTTKGRQLFHYPGWLQNTQNLAGTNDGPQDPIVSPATSAYANANNSEFAICSFTVTNVSLSSLAGKKNSALGSFEAALKKGLSQEAGEGVKPEDVELTMQAAEKPNNSVDVSGKLFTPKMDMAQWRLNTTHTAKTTLKQGIAKVQNIEKVSTGDIDVINWMAPMDEEEIQSEWVWWNPLTWSWKSDLLALLGLCLLCAPLGLGLYMMKKRKAASKGKKAHRGARLESSESHTYTSAVTRSENNSETDTSSEDDERQALTGRKSEQHSSSYQAGAWSSSGHKYQAAPLVQVPPIQMPDCNLDLITVTEGGIRIHQLKHQPPPKVPVLAGE